MKGVANDRHGLLAAIRRSESLSYGIGRGRGEQTAAVSWLGMMPDPASRWIVIGNSGSGKSTMAERVGTTLSLPVHDLDLVHWHADGRKRDEMDAKLRVADIAAGEGWVIEGVYGWLADVAAQRASVLIWLDLPWADCRAGLLARGRGVA